MFWFHNPNILRAVICSLFPFYSVILFLFFLLTVRAKRSCQEEKGSSSEWKSGNRYRGEGRGREGGERWWWWWRRRETERQTRANKHKQTGASSLSSQPCVKCRQTHNLLIFLSPCVAFWVQFRKEQTYGSEECCPCLVVWRARCLGAH